MSIFRPSCSSVASDASAAGRPAARTRWTALLLSCLATVSAAQTVILCPQNPSALETLAAREVRRYVYLRTGNLLPISQAGELREKSDLIVIGRKDQPMVRALASIDPGVKQAVESLQAGQYLLRSLRQDGRAAVLVVGGDAVGALYAAYRFAEHLGVRFYLHGDTVPDGRTALKLDAMDEQGKPLFDIRGIQPFHDFPEGPDWWDADDYKAVLSQLPKLRMNFIGLHTYPEGGVGPEPAVWIGLPQDLGEGGRVAFSYPSRHFSTWSGTWGYKRKNTSDYAFGAWRLFDRDDFGAEVMRGMCPWPATPEASNELFDRFGAVLNDAFTYAHRLGVKTCLGTETPMIVPSPLRQRLKTLGKDPASQPVVQELYEGTFLRIAKIGPLDYYWFWTPEAWTWQKDVKPDEVKRTLEDLSAALAAARKVGAPFTLATCGWVLGPHDDPARFDRDLPKDMPMSCINREVGRTPVEPAFARVTGRPKWAIPWLEDDQAMTCPQLWVGRMRKDAADALRYGCTGLIGIHWRTRSVAPNVSGLAKAAWDQSWRSGQTQPASTTAAAQERFLPAGDFYADWALAEFGPEAGARIAAIFTRMDCRVPRPSQWTDGPGGLTSDKRPWEQVRKEYEFVDDLAALAPLVSGAGAKERFGYWLSSFRYLRAMAELRCTWAGGDKQAVVKGLEEVYRHLLATVSTWGELGTVVNWEQHVRPGMNVTPGKEYTGPPRLIVPTVRSALVEGEDLRLRVIVLSDEKPSSAVLCWRPMGQGTFAEIPLSHVARGVYSATLPAKSIAGGDLEYYVKAAVGSSVLHFPATAPDRAQTVVIMPAQRRL